MAVLSPRAWFAGVIATATAGCGNVTNAVFAEDADYVAALPSDGHTTLSDIPGAGAADPGDLLAAALAGHAELDAALDAAVGAADVIRSAAPTSRTEEGRIWGPYDWSDADLEAASQRTGGTRYDWGFDVDGEGFATGTHYAGLTVASGDGAYGWDQGVLADAGVGTGTGRITVTYDNRDGVDLLVAEDDWSFDGATAPRDATLAFHLETGAGDLQLRAALPLGDDAAGAPLRVRWIEGVGGRADAVISVEGESDTWTECWDAEGALTYQVDAAGLVAPVAADAGDGVCAVHGVELPDRI